MASERTERVLEGLSGLFEGITEGLDKREARKLMKRELERSDREREYERVTRESERGFALRKYEEESKRAAMLDVMKQQEHESGIKRDTQAMFLAQEKADREKEQLTEIPVEVGGKTYNLPREIATQLKGQAALADLNRQERVPITSGERTFYVDPKDAANYYSESEEATSKRSLETRKVLTDLYQSLLQSGQDPQTAAQAVGAFGEKMFPDEFPSSSVPPLPQTEEETSTGELTPETNRLGWLAPMFNRRFLMTRDPAVLINEIMRRRMEQQSQVPPPEFAQPGLGPPPPNMAGGG